MTNNELTKKIEEEMNFNKGFAANNNFKLLTVSDNYCELEAEITETSLNPYGIAHGGFIFGLADTAAGVAARTVGRSSLTLDSNINYFREARGKKLKAIATCLKKGKNISVYKVSITDETNKDIAQATITYFYKD